MTVQRVFIFILQCSNTIHFWKWNWKISLPLEICFEVRWQRNRSNFISLPSNQFLRKYGLLVIMLKPTKLLRCHKIYILTKWMKYFLWSIILYLGMKVVVILWFLGKYFQIEKCCTYICWKITFIKPHTVLNTYQYPVAHSLTMYLRQISQIMFTRIVTCVNNFFNRTMIWESKRGIGILKMTML